MGSAIDTVARVGSGGLLNGNDVMNGATLGAYDSMDIDGSKAKNAALSAQNTATGRANSAITDAYKQQQGYLDPYKNAGAGALDRLSSGNILNKENLGMDEGYQFRLAQGNQAINNAAAARGMGNSGAAMKSLAAYGQNLASEEYDKAYNRQYQNLSQLAGYGSNASNNLASAAGAYGSNLSNNHLGLGNATAAANIAQSNQQNALLGQGIGAAATFFSDENLKEEMTPFTKEDFAEMKSVLKAYTFKYKDEKHGKGEWIGVKAQDLRKSKIGKYIVTEDETGFLKIDNQKLMSALLASMAGE